MAANILILEDEEPVRRLFGRILESRGYCCVAAENGGEAREKLKSMEFDLILCDINLPGESGLEFLEDVLPAHQDMATLVVTGNDDLTLARKAIELGVYGYITKPVEQTAILIHVINALRRRELEKGNRLYSEELESLVEERTYALRESEKRYRTILDSIGEGYFEVDLKGHFTFFNESFAKIVGYPGNTLLGLPFRKLTKPETTVRVYQEFNRIFSTGKAAKAIDWKIQKPDGSLGFVLLSASILTDSKGAPAGFRGIARDITEQKVLENQLVQAQKLEAIGQLAAGIAHEINTPIQYVGDNTRFLRDSFRDLMGLLDIHGRLKDAVGQGLAADALLDRIEDVGREIDIAYLMEEIPKAFEQSLEGVERVARIVRAMKDFSHPGQSEKAPADINKAIGNTITVARNAWKYVAEMETDLDPSLPLVSCLEGELNQVILNMIINAAHAIEDVIGDGSSGKGTIRISTRHYGQWVEIRVRDTGTGIPDRIRSRIFDPFFTTKQVGRGTGQGLTIAHSVIVEKHAGRIDLETEMGKGTTFIVRLPKEVNIEDRIVSAE